MYLKIFCGDVELPSPSSLSHNGELIWDAETGRATDGKMIGDIIAHKHTITIGWQFITHDDLMLIYNTLPDITQPFKEIKVITSDGYTVWEYTGYRSTISDVFDSCAGGEIWYSSVSTDLIEE